MTILTNTIYKALLAMDSYNRSYNQGLILPDEAADGVGDAEITTDSAVLLDANDDRRDIPAGFYAIAYDLNGEKVISYRGTDGLLPFTINEGTPNELEVGGDTYNGYGIGLGETAGPQAMLAFDFYNAVAGNPTNQQIDPRLANISLTGHSLGGGLAGLVSTVYGKTGTLFNNMAYEGAADQTYSLAISGAIGISGILQAKVYNSLTPWQTNQTVAITHETIGDFLDENRADKASDVLYNFVDPSLAGAGVPIPTFYGVQAHNMATLALRMYMDVATSNLDWQYSSKYVWPMLYDDSFAIKIGEVDAFAGAMKTADDYSGIVRTVLAYSMIDEGTLVFGSTGAKTFANDVQEFGKVLKQSPSTLLTDNGYVISEIIIQYAAGLAIIVI